MNRTLTRREKVLLLLLALLLLAMGYMKLFYEPLQTERIAAETCLADAEDAQLLEQAKLYQMQQMEAELEELKAAGTTQSAEIPVYDNVENVMVQLNAILSAAQDYSLTFSEVTFGEDGTASRPIEMTFTAAGYAAARSILDDLYHGWYRCSLSGMSIAGDEDVSQDSPVNVSVTVTFYEKLA